MKAIILPTRKEPILQVVTNQYNHLFVARNNGRSKKLFIFQQAYQVHPASANQYNWDESWFGNYE